VERKTRSREDSGGQSAVLLDLQANMYTQNYESLADSLLLDAGLFSGMYYFVSYKPLERLKKNETLEDLGKRYTSDTEVWSYPKDRFINDDNRSTLKETIYWADMTANHLWNLYDLHHSPRKIPCNSNSCMRYGKKCPYWELCYASR